MLKIEYVLKIDVCLKSYTVQYYTVAEKEEHEQSYLIYDLIMSVILIAFTHFLDHSLWLYLIGQFLLAHYQ